MNPLNLSFIIIKSAWFDRSIICVILCNVLWFYEMKLYNNYALFTSILRISHVLALKTTRGDFYCFTHLLVNLTGHVLLFTLLITWLYLFDVGHVYNLLVILIHAAFIGEKKYVFVLCLYSLCVSGIRHCPVK